MKLGGTGSQAMGVQETIKAETGFEAAFNPFLLEAFRKFEPPMITLKFGFEVCHPDL